jgi:hypothetical protein
LRYYAEARDLDYLLDKLEDEPGRSGQANEKMGRLNRAMVELLEDYGNVSFETLAVEVSFPDVKISFYANRRTRKAC